MRGKGFSGTHLLLQTAEALKDGSHKPLATQHVRLLVVQTSNDWFWRVIGFNSKCGKRIESVLGDLLQACVAWYASNIKFVLVVTTLQPQAMAHAVVVTKVQQQLESGKSGTYNLNKLE